MIIWLWIIRVVNSIVMLMHTIWVYSLMSDIFGSDPDVLPKMDAYHRVTLAVIILLGFIFTLLVYPICAYLEKKLKD